MGSRRALKNQPTDKAALWSGMAVQKWRSVHRGCLQTNHTRANSSGSLCCLWLRHGPFEMGTGLRHSLAAEK